MHNTVTLEAKFGLFPKCGDQAFAFASDSAQPVGSPTRKVPQVARAEIGQFALLPVSPEVFDRVEFGGVSRKTFHPEFPLKGGEVIADEMASVNGGTVPDYQKLARHMVLEMFEKLDHLGALDGPLKEAKIKVPPSQPAFIDEDNGAAFCVGLFFAAHVFRFHWAMAASSRSMTRPVGLPRGSPPVASRRHST